MRLISRLTIVAVGSICAVGAFTLAPSIPTANAYPQPSVYPVAWELDFVFESPKRIVVEIPGGAAPKAYWYMPYVATNNTDREQVFLPTFDLLTKEGRVVKSDMETSAAVFNAIARREAKWPLKPALENAGPILVGEDQAKYGVAIWEEPSSEPGMFSVYVTGLSGETAPLTDSEGKPINDKDGQPILLRKTLQLDFNVRGDELYAGDPIDQTGKQWVMR
ncbi:MAG TPA: hypothetical protein PK402_07140 [Tepidisphaeraceae bacterium]|nr:hypothetical protein [Tepidisphaeraceae bacterium]